MVVITMPTSILRYAPKLYSVCTYIAPLISMKKGSTRIRRYLTIVQIKETKEFCICAKSNLVKVYQHIKKRYHLTSVTVPTKVSVEPSFDFTFAT